MKMPSRLALALMAGVLTAPLMRAIPDAEATAGRLILRHYSDAVVTVLGTVTLRLQMDEHLLPMPDNKIDVSGTLISPTGLVATSLSMIEPSAIFDSIKAKMPGGGGNVIINQGQLKDLRYILGDGTVVYAQVVWKDANRDLALLAPSTPPSPGQTYAYVNLQAAPAFATVLGAYFELARTSDVLQRTPLVQPVTVVGIVERPRRLFLTTANAIGCPVFDTQSRVLGVCLRVVTNGTLESYMVVPAGEIASDASEAAQAAAQQ